MQQCMAVSFSEVTSKFLKLTAMVSSPQVFGGFKDFDQQKDYLINQHCPETQSNMVSIGVSS